MTMDLQNESNHVINIKLAKIIGLYQILDPGTVKWRGRNIYQIVTSCVFLYICLNSMILILSGLYYWTVNIPLSMDYFWKAVISFYIIYKTWIIVRYSNDIWNCLSVTRYDFTTLSNQGRHILHYWRERLERLTTIYATVYFTATVSYFAITLAFGEDKLPVKNHDGSIGYYRQNAMNLYLFVSDETYNALYFMFFFFETIFGSFIGIYLFIFDFLLVTLCLSMCCQMQIICSAFESVGHKSLLDHHSPIDYAVENIKISPNEHKLIYEELIRIIKDHQLVMKKYEDFLSLFRQVMLSHMFVSSLLVVAVSFTFIMSFSNDERFQASDVIVKKLFCVIPSLLFQIYMVCYLFGNIHNQKDSIIFALYSSNWTEMDMKCKKMILLMMKLNNANHKKLKYTRTKIVNLEMFFKTMGDCYTVISVLVNYIQQQNE